MNRTAVASGFEVGPGMYLDRFYRHLFASDSHAIGFITELGLGDELIWRRLRLVAWLAYLRFLSSPDAMTEARPGPGLGAYCRTSVLRKRHRGRP